MRRIPAYGGDKAIVNSSVYQLLSSASDHILRANSPDYTVHNICKLTFVMFAHNGSLLIPLSIVSWPALTSYFLS